MLGIGGLYEALQQALPPKFEITSVTAYEIFPVAIGRAWIKTMNLLIYPEAWKNARSKKSGNHHVRKVLIEQLDLNELEADIWVWCKLNNHPFMIS